MNALAFHEIQRHAVRRVPSEDAHLGLPLSVGEEDPRSRDARDLHRVDLQMQVNARVDVAQGIDVGGLSVTGKLETMGQRRQLAVWSRANDLPLAAVAALQWISVGPLRNAAAAVVLIRRRLWWTRRLVRIVLTQFLPQRGNTSLEGIAPRIIRALNIDGISGAEEPNLEP